MDLSTRYLGLPLENPLVASASPLSRTIDGVRRLADGGVSAIVLHSLFQEQLEAARDGEGARAGDGFAPSSSSRFPIDFGEASSPEAYLSLLERAADDVGIPVIASLNGTTPDTWSSLARSLEDAGAAAIELNVDTSPSSLDANGRELEACVLDTFRSVRAAVAVPIAVKLSPFFSSIGEMALRLDEAGVQGLVLFNRFVHLDFDPETIALEPGIGMSVPEEGRLARTWIALLRSRIRASLAGSTGVETANDVVRYLLAGADVVMTASALLRHGPSYASELLEGLGGWMTEKGFTNLGQVRGLLVPAAASLDGGDERTRYVRALGTADAMTLGDW